MLVLTLTRVFLQFPRRMAMPYFSLFILSLGGLPEDIGYVRTVRTLAALLTFPLAGYLADQRGRVKIIAVAGYLTSLTFLFNIFARNWIDVAAGVFLQGLFSVHFPALGAIMADSLSPQQRGIGFAASMAIPGAICILSPYIGGYLVDRYGAVLALRWGYVFVVALGLVSATLRFKFLKETIDSSSSKVSLSDIPRIMKESYKSSIEALRWMPRSLWSLTILMVLTSISNSVVGPFWVIYAIDRIGLSATQWGVIGLIAAVLRSLLGMPAGMLVDKINKKNILVASLIPTVISVYYFIKATTFWEVLVIALIISTANAFLMPACQTLFAENIPMERRGRIMAAIGRGVIMVTGPGGGGGGPVMGFIQTFPVIIGSLAGGYIYSANNELPWIILTAALVASTATSIFLIKEPDKTS